MIEQTYLDLMNQLRSLPKRITDARAALLEAGKAAKAAERAVESVKADAIISAGGYAGLGKNEGEREVNLSRLLSNDRQYQSASANHRNAEYQTKQLQGDLDNLKAEFDVARSMAALHGEFMRYTVLVTASPVSNELSDL